MFELLLLSFETESKNTLKIKSPAYCGDNTPLTPYAFMSAKKTWKGTEKDQAQALNSKHTSCNNGLKPLLRRHSIFQGGPNQRFILKSVVAINFWGFVDIEKKMEMAL